MPPYANPYQQYGQYQNPYVAPNAPMDNPQPYYGSYPNCRRRTNRHIHNNQHTGTIISSQANRQLVGPCRHSRPRKDSRDRTRGTAS